MSLAQVFSAPEKTYCGLEVISCSELYFDPDNPPHYFRIVVLKGLTGGTITEYIYY
jgi:hypothetical protein